MADKAKGILIFAPMQIEADAIKKSLARLELPDNLLTDVVTIGLRAALLQKPLPSTIRGARLAAVILAGLAGGLDPSLKCGEVVIDLSHANSSRPSPPYAGETWSEGLSRAGAPCNPPLTLALSPEYGGEGIGAISRARFERIHSTSRVIGSVADKRELFQKSGGATAVDMEGDLVARAASEAGMPLIHIRAISDPADCAVDPAVINLVDQLGRPKIVAVARLLATRPTMMPELVRLRTNTKLALKNLGLVLADVVCRLAAQE